MKVRFGNRRKHRLSGRCFSLVLFLLPFVILVFGIARAAELSEAVVSQTLISPVHRQVVSRGPLSFSWQTVPNATGYGIELLDAAPENPNGVEPSRNRIAADLSPNGQPSYPGDTTDLAPGTYYWRIIAIRDGQIYGGFSDAWSFTIPLVLLSPSDGSCRPVKGPLSFSWQTVPNATGYGIELLDAAPENPNGVEPSRNRIAADLSPNGQPSYPGDTTDLAPGTYYWRIIAIRDGQIYGGFSDAWSFTIPPRPSLTAPSNGYAQADRGALLFDWENLPGASVYGIELLSAPPENPNGVDQSRYRIAAAACAPGISQYSGDTSGLAPGRYWWRVIGYSQSGACGVFSDARSFDVPAKPVLSSPGSGYSQQHRGSLLFNWQSLPGATAYGIELLSALPENPNGTEPSRYRIAAALSPNGSTAFPGDTTAIAAGTYYWRVIAFNDQGTYGVFGNAWSFSVPDKPYPPLGLITFGLINDYPLGTRSDHGTGYGTPGSIPGHNVWIEYGDAYDFMCGGGVSVYAAHSGTVTEAGTGLGGWTIIKGTRFTTVYAHTQSGLRVGDYVTAGSRVGATDVAIGHLHFEMWDGVTSVPAGNMRLYF